MPEHGGLYYFESRGESSRLPPVVLIHGAGGNHLSWPSQMRRIPGYRILAPDLPGHGKSAGSGLQTIAEYTGAVLGWLDSLNISRAVIVGHSMGSAIALQIGLNYSERTVALGLYSGGARLRVSPRLLEQAGDPRSHQQAAALLVEWSFSPSAPAALVQEVQRRILETRLSVLHADFIACNAFDVSQELNRLGCPVLVVCGTQDKMTPMRNAIFLASSIPQATLHLVQEAGHMVMLEAPGESAEALQKFLKLLLGK
jgi:pimeloyl-ACP methyl ester carboxylesterase